MELCIKSYFTERLDNGEAFQHLEVIIGFGTGLFKTNRKDSRLFPAVRRKEVKIQLMMIWNIRAGLG